MTEIIVSNQVECRNCGDRPYSAHSHDFKYCSCGKVAVDGGASYLRRLGDPAAIKELSIVTDESKVDYLIKEVDKAVERDCNSRGLVYTVLRGLRDTNLLKEEK